MAYTQIQKIENPIPSASDKWGVRSVVDGYHMIVARSGTSLTKVYKRDIDGVWQNQGTVTGQTGQSMSGNYFTVAVAASQDLKIYDKDSLSSPLQTLNESTDGTATFGNSVVISENYIVIGDQAKDTNTGQIFIYEKTGTNSWTAYANNPVEADALNEQDFFGSSVATNDESIIIGALGDNSKKGAVYIFQKDVDTGVWEQTQKIFASDGLVNDQFGESISASGDHFVVGASLKDSLSGDINSGAAYVFKYSTSWFEIDKLVSVDETDPEGDHFGESVYINGDHIIVGSPAARLNKGVADVFFKKRSWGHLKKILGSDTAADDDFGTSVSISGRFIAVGSPDNESATIGGSAYVYEDPPVRLRLAQEFEVNSEYLPSKASVYLKRVGQNLTDYWPIYNTSKTVIDATNFSTIDQANTEGEMVIDADQFIKLVAGDPESSARFGNSVSISGDYAIIGADRKDVPPVNNNEGVAYIFYKDPDNPSSQWNEVRRLTASDPEEKAYFGEAVSISGDYAIVGAGSKNELPGNDDEGAAYIFYRDPDNPSNQWNEVRKIIASDAEKDAHFGDSLSISGDYAIVGAYLKNEGVFGNAGAAYIFYKDPDNPSNQWNEVKKIVASDLEATAHFGVSVSISGNYVVVGAEFKNESPGNDNEGAAYIFYKDQGGVNNWGQVKKIVASDREKLDNFGISVSISGSYVVVGAHLEDGDEGAEGAAYIFYKDQGGVNNWGQVKKIVASNRKANDFFGWSVSISGDYVVVGAYQKWISLWQDEGAAYIFYKDQGGVNNWGQVKKIVASDPEFFANFGWSVSISGDYVISGAYHKNEPPGDDNEGAAYVFEIETVFEGSNIITFNDITGGFTGNGYMISQDELYPASDFGVINYPIRAITPDTYDLWLRVINTSNDNLEIEMLIDGNVTKTISTFIDNPSDGLEWTWVSTSLVLPDNRDHILGIRIKENNVAIDKMYIEVDSTTPYTEGPDLSVSPYITAHMKVYDSLKSEPNSPIFVYDYKNSITEIIQDDWYNFDIKVLDETHGYMSASDFHESFYLVMSLSGSNTSNFVVWELIDNDEYSAPSSAIRF